ncbi:MAG: DUF5977 domain-containing protein [Flavisolibacter sp.]
MRILKITFLLISINIKLIGFSQPAQNTNLLPVVSPASPDVAGIARFGNYQVNLFTGLPDISIPLYEIQVGSLKVPISFNYHAGGNKITDIPSRVGLGWSLSSGGSITRKIQGIPDDQPNGYFLGTTTLPNVNLKLTSEIDLTTQASMDYVEHVRRGDCDGEPDIFSYNFPGHSGKFMYDQRNNFNVIFIPYAPLLVSKTPLDPYVVKFDITDESGTIYKFKDYEWTSSGSGVTTNAASAWMLSSIYTPNLQDSIKFNYSTGGGQVDSYFSDYWVVNDHADGSYNSDLGNGFRDLAGVTTTWQQLNQIDFPGGKVVFESDAQSRSDFHGIYALQHRLSGIKVYSYDPLRNSYTLIRYVQLFHSYFINGSDLTTQRLRMDSLQIRDGNSSIVQTYRFNYNTSIALPINTSCMKDYWGYFNNQLNTRSIGTTSVETTIPHMQVPYTQPISNPTTNIWIGGNNANSRITDPNYMQAYILQKITYPTGGNSQFEYETNQYLDANNVAQYAGGLRVKSIKSYDGINANPIVKTYKYGLNESGYGRANFFLETYLFTNVRNYQLIDMTNSCCPCGVTIGHKSTETYFANPTNDIENYDGSPVVYYTVTEYTGDGITNIGKTVYQFSDKSDAKTSVQGLGRNYFDSYHFIRGLLTRKSEYKRNPDGTIGTIPIKETRKGYQFQPFQWSSPAMAIVIQKTLITDEKVSLDGTISPDVSLGPHLIGGHCADDGNNFRLNNYNLVSGDNKLIADTTIIYDDQDPTRYVSTITTYSYDDLTHLGLTQVQTTNSKGEILKAKYTYPYNYTTYPNNNMTSSHIWNKVITAQKLNGATQLSLQTNIYYSFGTPSLYAPQTVQLQILSNPAETRASFSNYDSRGNILEMQKTNDVKQSFIWDYQKRNVIALVTNASQSDIAYTSFETDGNGGWTGVNTTNIFSNRCVTGKRSYYSTNFSFSKSGLTSTNTYIVSYWSANGAYSIAGTITGFPKSLRTLTFYGQSWTYYEHQVTGQTTITISGNGAVDELRLYPLGSQMTTYTYEQMIGASTQCDANNRLLFYTYDELGRLILMRDDNLNILKQNCYNYFGQTGTCSIYSNDAQSGSYSKSCPPNNTAGSVTYSLPAGICFSTLSKADANSKSLSLLNTEGPLYANLYATCTPIMYTITGSDSKSIGYTVLFKSHTNGAILYSFSLSSGASNINLGQVAAGSYDVQFQPGANPPFANFYVNGYSQRNQTSALFSNISISGASTVTVN